jgi:hypothetical protein
VNTTASPAFCSFLSTFRRLVRHESARPSPAVYSDLSYHPSPEQKHPLEAVAAKRRKRNNKHTAGNMFKRSFRSNTSQVADPQHRVDKSARLTKRNGGGGINGAAGSVRDPQKLSKLQRSLANVEDTRMTGASQKSLAPSPIVTITVGREGRLFAAHEDVLCQSPFFEVLCKGQYLEAQGKRIALPEEEPEVFSAVLEYLYKGDYYPRLLHNKHRNSWELEDSTPSNRRTPHASPNLTENGGGRAGGSSPYTPSAVEATVYLTSCGQHLLRDTVVYCAAERYGLEELKRLALRKQGLQSGIDVGTILRSAQYCYAHTPDSDSRLRAHYLALIIRCRKTFKRSGTMQAEMERGGEGGKLFFDLFVALCNHLDDVIEASNSRTPKTI